MYLRRSCVCFNSVETKSKQIWSDTADKRERELADTIKLDTPRRVARPHIEILLEGWTAYVYYAIGICRYLYKCYLYVGLITEVIVNGTHRVSQ